MTLPTGLQRASNRRLSAALAPSLLAGACASTSPVVRQVCRNPDAQLAAVLQPFEELRTKGCGDGSGPWAMECERLRRGIERLSVVWPGHVPTLMANAVIAYDEHRPAQSQQLLDQILARAQSHPDATVLRARIAIEEGNLPFARRLLEQQINLAPDHAGLHETFAVLYLGGQLLEARHELATAGALGSPRWRIAYHLGLIEESAGRLDDAIRYYGEALEGNPGWTLAQARLNAVRARRRPDRSRQSRAREYLRDRALTDPLHTKFKAPANDPLRARLVRSRAVDQILPVWTDSVTP
jgi:tetratricopeptide (TPR) repeat protein